MRLLLLFIVEKIYRAGIETGNATFEQKTPEWSAWDASHHQHSRLVAMMNGDIIGWAAISPVSKRAVYAGVAEESIYIAESARGQGVTSRASAPRFSNTATSQAGSLRK